jgi:ABC-2 type transport system ATP-binding protein
MAAPAELAGAVIAPGVHDGAIRVENIVFDYPTQRALHGITFEVTAGSVTALVGPNGAGKTTLMRCVAALETPFAGRVLADGRDVHDDPRVSHRQLGYLSDFFGLYDDLTVTQCLRHAAAMHGLAGGDETVAVERAVDLLDMRELAKKKAGEMSRGQRQRLGIAQAIIHDPRIVLLDEPASGLDPLARQSLSALLLRLRDHGMTLIVSSHILAELEDYSSHVLVLDRGRLVDHRALGGETTHTRYRVDIAEGGTALAAILAKQAAVGDVIADAAGATFKAPRDLMFRRDLLRALVEAGVPVVGLKEATLGLRDIYREVAGEGGEA